MTDGVGYHAGLEMKTGQALESADLAHLSRVEMHLERGASPDGPVAWPAGIPGRIGWIGVEGS
jgi:hypothetical protein